MNISNEEYRTGQALITKIMMYKDFDIVMIGQSRWDNPYSSPAFSLAKEFAKHNRVFYIDHPFTLKDYISQYKNGNTVKSRKKALLFGKDIYKKIDGVPQNLTVVIPKLTLPINWLQKGFIYNFFSGLNDKVLFQALRKTIKDFSIKKYIFINSFDPFYFRNFPKNIKPEIYVYQTIDDISQEKYIARHGVKLEEEAVRKADFSLATSSELTKSLSKFTNNVFCLPNAADFSLFQRAFTDKLKRPVELENINKRIICYTGVIGTRINYGLLKKLATTHSDKVLLMVGPLDNDSYKKVGLDKLSNVVFTGAKKIADLPFYLQHSDCCIIPFEYSKLTKSIYPLKINEYLTAGKPVVATSFSEDIKEFSDVAYVSETEEDFIKNIDLAISENSEEKQQLRIQKAEKNSWEGRVKKFWEIIDDLKQNGQLKN